MLLNAPPRGGVAAHHRQQEPCHHGQRQGAAGRDRVELSRLSLRELTREGEADDQPVEVSRLEIRDATDQHARHRDQEGAGQCASAHPDLQASCADEKRDAEGEEHHAQAHGQPQEGRHRLHREAERRVQEAAFQAAERQGRRQGARAEDFFRRPSSSVKRCAAVCASGPVPSAGGPSTVLPWRPDRALVTARRTRAKPSAKRWYSQPRKRVTAAAVTSA